MEDEATTELYVNAHQQSEKWNKIVYFMFMKIFAPSILVPLLIHVFYDYFTTDLGNDAFQLPSPFWLVHNLKILRNKKSK